MMSTSLFLWKSLSEQMPVNNAVLDQGCLGQRVGAGARAGSGRAAAAWHLAAGRRACERRDHDAGVPCPAGTGAARRRRSFTDSSLGWRASDHSG